jgi:hypothetical protein
MLRCERVEPVDGVPKRSSVPNMLPSESGQACCDDKVRLAGVSGSEQCHTQWAM